MTFSDFNHRTRVLYPHVRGAPQTLSVHNFIARVALTLFLIGPETQCLLVMVPALGGVDVYNDMHTRK